MVLLAGSYGHSLFIVSIRNSDVGPILQNSPVDISVGSGSAIVSPLESLLGDAVPQAVNIKIQNSVLMSNCCIKNSLYGV